MAGVRARYVVDRVDDLFGKSVRHGQTLSARDTPGMAIAATATTDPHVHLLPAERTAGLMRWLHRGLPGVAIPQDITWEGALDDLRAAGARRVVNLLFPLRAGEAEELHRFGAALSAREPDVVPVGGVHKDDPDPERVVRTAIEDHGMRGLKLHPMVQRFSPGHPALEPAIAALAATRCRCTCTRASTSGTGGATTWASWSASPSDIHEIPLVLCHCAFPRLEWAAEMARRHPQVWLDTTNVFGSIELAPEPARAGLLDKVADLFDAAPDRDLLRHRLPGRDGVARAAARPGPAPAASAEQMAANAARFVNESFGLDLERARSSKVH